MATLTLTLNSSSASLITQTANKGDVVTIDHDASISSLTYNAHNNAVFVWSPSPISTISSTTCTFVPEDNDNLAFTATVGNETKNHTVKIEAKPNDSDGDPHGHG